MYERDKPTYRESRMTIRIDRIGRRDRDRDRHYSWLIRMKGLQGQGIYCYLPTGVDGHGLSYSESELDSFAELLPADRFYPHAGLNAEQVAHRVAACLLCIGWGPDFYDDRDSITDGGLIATFVLASGKASS